MTSGMRIGKAMALSGTGKQRILEDSRSGAIMGVVLIVVVVVTALGSGLIALTGSSSLEVSKSISAAEAFWTAEAGLEYTKALIAKNPASSLEDGAFQSGQTLSGSIDGLNFSVTYQANAVTSLYYQIVSTATSRGGLTREVEMNAWLQSVTKYLNAWNLGGLAAAGHPYRFYDSDRFYGDGIGEAYFNARVSIQGYPEFDIPVYSTSDNDVIFTLPHRTEDDGSVFMQGYYDNASTVNFLDPDDPGYVDFMGILQNAASSGGLSLSGDYRITFLDNGTMTYEELSSGGGSGKGKGKGGGSGTVETYDLSLGNGAIYVDGDVEISGELRGEVTLGVSQDILIVDDIIYASATAADHSDVAFDKNAVTDTLGLIAGDSVNFSEDLSVANIHAAIVVTDGSFGCNSPSYSGTINVNLFGSIVQYDWTGSTDARRTWVKNYYYDSRLLLSPPAYFPLNGYAYSGWRQTH